MSTAALDRIKAIAKYVNPRIAPFDSDTPIASCFRGRSLKRFWRDCQAHSNGRLPDLKKRPGTAIFDRIVKPLAIPVVLIGTVAWLTQIPVADIPILYMIAAFIVGIVVAAIWYVAWAVPLLILDIVHARRHSVEGLLPKGITTFGALADFMEGARGGWCHTCGYDLTGLEIDKCPECGTPLDAPKM